MGVYCNVFGLQNILGYGYQLWLLEIAEGVALRAVAGI